MKRPLGSNHRAGSGSTSRPAAGYDWLAGKYRCLEWLCFAGSLDRARKANLAWLVKHTAPSNILVSGDGEGRLLGELLGRFADASITSIDFSRAMIRRQQRVADALGARHRVRWIESNAIDWHPPDAPPFDLWVAAFFLDCFDARQLDELIPRWLAHCHSSGHVCVVDFVPPHQIRSAVQRAVARVRMAMMVRLFRIVTHRPDGPIPDFRDLFLRHGCTVAQSVRNVGHSVESTVFHR